MKNYGDLGGRYLPRPAASTDNTLLDLHNSSLDTQPHSLIVKYSIVLLHLTLQADVSVASYYTDCSNLTVKTKPKINNSSKIKTKNSIMIIIKYTNIEFRSCFLRFYVLWWCARRIPLAKNSSWEFVYHINTLFVSPWKFKSSCITHLRHDSGFRTL